MQKLFIRVQATLWRRFAPVVVQSSYIHEYLYKRHLLVGKKIRKKGADGRWLQQPSSFLHPQPPPQIPPYHTALKFLPCGHVVWIFSHNSSPTLLKCTSLTNRSKKAKDSLGPVSLGFHPWPSLHHRDALHEIWERNKRQSLCLCCLFILTSTAMENVEFSVAGIRKAPESGLSIVDAKEQDRSIHFQDLDRVWGDIVLKQLLPGRFSTVVEISYLDGQYLLLFWFSPGSSAKSLFLIFPLFCKHLITFCFN